jgi:ABC-type multidrug transport system permease subunit
MKGIIAVARAVAWRTIHNFFLNPTLLIPSLAFPLLFFTAFAGGLSTISRVPNFNYAPGYTAFQFAFVLIQASAFGGVFTGFSIARDFETGFARRLLLAAPQRVGILVGYAMAAAVRTMFTVILIFLVAVVTGMHVDGNGIDLFGLVGLALIVNVCATMWASGVALRIRSIQGGPAMQMPIFLLLFLAPVYVPLPLLSGWIHAVASVNPATAFLEAGRSLLAGDTAHVLVALGAGAALVVLFSIWALRGLRKAEMAG